LRIFALILTLTCFPFSSGVVRRSPFSYLITKFRRRVYPVDSESPRVYLSTNPWKVTSTIQTVSSTRDEYVALVERLKASAPTKPKLKTEFAHQNLIAALEGRLEAIDKEHVVRFLGNNSASRLRCGAPLLYCLFLFVLSFFFVVCEAYVLPANTACAEKGGATQHVSRPGRN